ncbi:hypothetical protein D3C75_1141940 [compost metagenome]
MRRQGTFNALRAAGSVRANAIASRIELLPVAFSPRIISDGACLLDRSPGLTAGALKVSLRSSIALKLLISTEVTDSRVG